MDAQTRCGLHECMEKVGEFGCMECNHQFQNEKEVTSEYLALLDRTGIHPSKIPTVKTIDDVPFCPVCCHDW